MPTGSTHLFSVSPFSFSCTSHFNVITPLYVESSFSAFVSHCFTSKEDVKLWDKPLFSVPCLLCHDAPVGDWFVCACSRVCPSSTGFSSISVSSSTSSTHIPVCPSPVMFKLILVLSCTSKNRFLGLTEKSLCNDPLNLGFDHVPVALRRKRHSISTAGIGPIISERVNINKTSFTYEAYTANLNLGDNILLAKLLSPHVKLLTHGSKSVAAYDLYSTEKLILLPKDRKLVDT